MIAGVITQGWPFQPQVDTAHRDSDMILSSISSALTVLTMPPRLVASVIIPDWKPANYVKKTSIHSLHSDLRHSTVSPEGLLQQ
eukprot:4610281-Ditylum_brightwellii.AAC.1